MRLLLVLALSAWIGMAAPVVAAPCPASVVAAPLGDCATCGRHIYFGERCVRCIVVEKRAAHSHPCATCEKPILVGELCASCAMAKAKASLAHECADCGATIHLGPRCASCATKRFKAEFKGAIGRAKAASTTLGKAAEARLAALFEPGKLVRTEQARAVAKAEAGWLERSATWTAALAETSGTQLAEGALELDRHAAIALGSALEIATTIESKKRDLTEAGLEKVLAIPVKSELGWTSLGDLAAAKFLARVPAAQGTDLVEDPAAVLASLILADPMVFLMDLKLVPDEAGPLTIVDALAKKSTSDPKTALACLSLIEATRRLQRGENITRSLRDISRALELLATNGR